MHDFVRVAQPLVISILKTTELYMLKERILWHIICRVKERREGDGVTVDSEIPEGAGEKA